MTDGELKARLLRAMTWARQHVDDEIHSHMRDVSNFGMGDDELHNREEMVAHLGRVLSHLVEEVHDATQGYYEAKQKEGM